MFGLPAFVDMTRSGFRSIEFRLFLATVVLGLCLPVAAFSAGLSFVPDATVRDIHPERANLSVLTYEVPGGLLVADRLAPGNESRFGLAFAPRFEDSEFYLIQEKCHSHSAAEVAARLSGVGLIHWTSEDVLVVEIPAAKANDFAGMDIDRTHIPLDTPPVGWDRNLNQAVTAPEMSGDKDLALVQDYVGNVSEPAFFLTIQEISGNTTFEYNGTQSVSTRYYSTADKTLVGDYLADKLTGYGYSVEFDAFISGSTPCRNIVATKTGTTYPDEYVVVGGHYDSVSENAPVLAPGAEDNGSGTASVMEIARISAGHDFERSVQFVLFDSEEQGLYGSYHFVNEATATGRNIIAAITMDMVAYFDDHYAVRIEGQPSWEWLMSIMETQTNLHTDIGNQKDYNSWGSDHVPFQQAGIPAFLAIDYDWGSYPSYHRTTDDWREISDSAHIGTQITIACAATLAEVAVLESSSSPVGDFPEYGPIDLVAYPNPFNPQVMVAFSPERNVTGEVAVFDLTGRKVAVLAQGEFSQGLNQVTWNGKDAGGRGVSSGTYICRLTAGDLMASVSVSLVR